MTMPHQNLVDELEDVIADKNIGHRAAMLRSVADLFMSASGKLSEEHIALFDDVMSRLVDEIETSARATFGHVMAMAPDAPPRFMRRLALDDAMTASPLTRDSLPRTSSAMPSAK
jgi:uncharacterized protein (DUF2336 family)